MSLIGSAFAYSIIAAFTISAHGRTSASSLSDKQIKKILIEESIAAYSGNCPCPDNRDRAGRRCGKRSAYIRPGGESPLCYESDVTPPMIKKYRENH